jgi:hypothetical protein
VTWRVKTENTPSDSRLKRGRGKGVTWRVKTENTRLQLAFEAREGGPGRQMAPSVLHSEQGREWGW